MHLISYFVVNLIECSKRLQLMKTLFDLNKNINQLSLSLKLLTTKGTSKENMNSFPLDKSPSKFDLLGNDNKLTIISVKESKPSRNNNMSSRFKRNESNKYFLGKHTELLLPTNSASTQSTFKTQLQSTKVINSYNTQKIVKENNYTTASNNNINNKSSTNANTENDENKGGQIKKNKEQNTNEDSFCSKNSEQLVKRKIKKAMNNGKKYLEKFRYQKKGMSVNDRTKSSSKGKIMSMTQKNINTDTSRTHSCMKSHSKN